MSDSESLTVRSRTSSQSVRKRSVVRWERLLIARKQFAVKNDSGLERHRTLLASVRLYAESQTREDFRECDVRIGEVGIEDKSVPRCPLRLLELSQPHEDASLICPDRHAVSSDAHGPGHLLGGQLKVLLLERLPRRVRLTPGLEKSLPAFAPNLHASIVADG